MNKIDELGERMSEAAAHCLFTLINWMEQVYDLAEPIIVPLCRIGGLLVVVVVSAVIVYGGLYLIAWVIMQAIWYFGLI